LAGLLLDSHALYWLVSGAKPLSQGALVAIGEGQASGSLFVSPITAWELAIAARKPLHKNPPQLTPNLSKWFRAAVRGISAKVAPIRQTIAIEAAQVAISTGHTDPGDCDLIATARIRRFALVTRDAVILQLAANGYLEAIVC